MLNTNEVTLTPYAIQTRTRASTVAGIAAVIVIAVLIALPLFA